MRRLAALGKLPILRCVGQASHFLLQVLHHGRDVVDRQFHLLVVAFVGLGDQFVDFATRDLGENAVGLADRQENRIQHAVHAANNLRVGAVVLAGVGARRKFAFRGRVRQHHRVRQQTIERQLLIAHGACNTADEDKRDDNSDCQSDGRGRRNRHIHGLGVVVQIRLACLQQAVERIGHLSERLVERRGE